jgi:pimeloyl-ACP methyl ester carboxylesterase
MHGDAITVASGISNDLPSWEEAYECALQLPHHSAVSFEGIVTKAAYESLPVSYILCEKDYILSPETQRRFIGVLEEVQGKKIDVVSLDSGHCPNWSQPDKLVEILIKEAQK